MFVDRDHIGGLAAVDQLAYGLEDQLVLMAVEIAVRQQIANAVPRIVVQPQAAQHA
ncbi:hypothetical protein D3C71_2178040 [compost metagenome]